MRIALVVALLGVLTVGGSLLAVGINTNQIYLGRSQRASSEDVNEQQFPVPPGDFVPPFEVRYNPTDFTGKVGGLAGTPIKPYLSIARGETKTVRYEVIPNERLTKSSLFQVTIGQMHYDHSTKSIVTQIPSIEVSFQPSQFTVNPGQTSSYSITFVASNDAPNGAYSIQYKMTGDAFPGSRRSETIDLLVGNAALPPLDNPPKEKAPP